MKKSFEKQLKNECPHKQDCLSSAAKYVYNNLLFCLSISITGFESIRADNDFWKNRGECHQSLADVAQTEMLKLAVHVV
jgi:hypothetical protein